MTAGYSGSYAFNGSSLALQPTEGKWIPRTMLGIDGAGHPIYSGVREFEMRFVLGNPSDYNQFQTSFNSLSNTGTAVVDLPQYGAANYLFYSYSGCVIYEPEANIYFTQHHTEIVVMVGNIRT